MQVTAAIDPKHSSRRISTKISRDGDRLGPIGIKTRLFPSRMPVDLESLTLAKALGN